MSRYIARRMVALLPILFGVSAVAFLILHLIPGDPATVYVGEHGGPGAIERVRH